MSLPLYTTLKAWRRARHIGQGQMAGAAGSRTISFARTSSPNATVYAAGIACAGQVPERTHL